MTLSNSIRTEGNLQQLYHTVDREVRLHWQSGRVELRNGVTVTALNGALSRFLKSTCGLRFMFSITPLSVSSGVCFVESSTGGPGSSTNAWLSGYQCWCKRGDGGTLLSNVTAGIFGAMLPAVNWISTCFPIAENSTEDGLPRESSSDVWSGMLPSILAPLFTIARCTTMILGSQRSWSTDFSLRTYMVG